MNRQRTLLQEETVDPKAIKELRAEPIPQPQIDRSLTFLRAIVLDLPIQTGGKIDTETRQVVETEEINPESSEDLDSMKKLAGLK
jgi:hypothetical protein